ncbi:hypothetical protein DNU06_05205 [Putridiphycobacter roseus]|uniref:Phospholipid/glycerol acyltransferase domain-containing protein n=2 Tax=Putridiphycobacter roseus TaxID=2219161 RepID=A0A2W1NJ84_9FLAO|nr:hypothetical protein DNU06_05205 [Putridiphycobacter roseus]
MRPLYFLLKVLISYAILLFFKRRKTVNAPKKFNEQTIFVVNHASAFMDPWVIAELQRPVLFFLTRGDIFKTWLRPITWAAHMIPIFRTKENGADSAEKNEQVFQEVYNLLRKKKSILIFGEGYTDDVFIRSLKSLKKGPARIGFGAMEANDWKLDIKIQSSGINYADPNEFRSEVLVSNSKPIHLKDFKAEYIKNKAKTITKITKMVTVNLQEQLTYLEDEKLTVLHNQIQSITKKGIAHHQSDERIKLETRWRYSQKLATFINGNYSEEDPKWITLKSTLSSYFKLLKKEQIEDQWVLDYSEGKKPNLFLRGLLLLVCLPIFLIGCFHHLIPYLFVKRFTEKTFKRRVFWSGIKLIMGYVVLALFNILLCLFLNYAFDLMDTWILWIYILFIVPPFGVVAYWYALYFKQTLQLAGLDKNKLEKLKKEREKCAALITADISLH